ncbi:MAG: response regulator [Planctomycetes bacterium]|nr:response regulator [Planctomycetota bacterium]
MTKLNPQTTCAGNKHMDLIIVILSLILVMGAIIMVWQISRVHSNLLQSLAVDHAARLVNTLPDYRSLHRKEHIQRHGQIHLADDFDDGDFVGWSTVDEGRVELPSTWSAARGHLMHTFTGQRPSNLDSNLSRLGAYVWYHEGLSWTNYRMSVSIMSQDDDALGIMVRYQNPENYYRFSLDREGGVRRLVKRENGVFQLLAEEATSYVSAQWYDIEILVQDDTVTIKDLRSGKVIFHVVDSGTTLITGSIALYGWANNGSFFDNVQVEALGHLHPLIEVPQHFQDNKTDTGLPASSRLWMAQDPRPSGTKIIAKRYSPHPFPWRETEGGLSDNFRQQAWSFLSKNPDQPFFDFQEIEGRTVLRYAIAEVMKDRCVNCHNAHPESPKKDWAIGQVRGVIEVNQPIETMPVITRNRIWKICILFALLGAIWLWLVIRKLHRSSVKLEHLVEERTTDLRIANNELERQVFQQQQTQEALNASEKHLRQAQKMEVIGALSGGIAHDFNNILSGIIGYAEMALTTTSEDRTRRHLHQVFNGGQRAKNLVTQILALSRQTDYECKPVDLKSTLIEVLELLRATLPTTIEIRQHLTSQSTIVFADAVQMHQILLNLCTNAEYAMREKGGILEIWLESLEVSSEKSTRNPDLTAGPYIMLIVRDTGQGMPPDVLNRVFEPYFTTKGPGEGTGIGLAVLHGIITNHRGTVEVESTPDQGTTFTIYLPRLEISLVPEIHEVDTPPRGQGRVLFVDDEEPLAQLGKEMLELLGYDVVIRTSSSDALRTFCLEPNRYDVVITDLTMPNISGDDFARELLNIRPDLPVILCTGFSHTMTQEKAETLGIRAFLMKPLLMKELALTLQKVLNP